MMDIIYVSKSNIVGLFFNMNARLYDPLLGRMLGPDKYIQHPTNAQNYNRYSYVLNNPLRFNDPTGNEIPGGKNNAMEQNWKMASLAIAAQFEEYHSQMQERKRNVAEIFLFQITRNGGHKEESLETDGGDPKKKEQKNMGVGTWDPVTDQRISQLDPKLQGPATDFINAAQAQGVNLRITEGFRTFSEQDALYSQGRTTPGKIVTNAKGGESYHNYGLAFDVVIMQNGQPVWNRLPSNIGALGTSFGFEWGGNWRTFKDYPHFQMTFGKSILQLQKR